MPLAVYEDQSKAFYFIRESSFYKKTLRLKIPNLSDCISKNSPIILKKWCLKKFLKNFKKYKTFLQPLCHIGETIQRLHFLWMNFRIKNAPQIKKRRIKNEENEKNRNRTVHRIGSNLFNRFRICPFRYFWWQDPDVYDGVWSYGRHCFLLLRRVWNCGENGRQDSKMGLAHRTISI